MSKKIDELVDEALAVERELRLLTPDRPSLRCYICECLERAGATYPGVEEIKARLEEPLFASKSGTAAYVRDLTRRSREDGSRSLRHRIASPSWVLT